MPIIIKLVIDEVVIEGESVKIFATIPLPNKIHPVREKSLQATEVASTGAAFSNGVNEREMDKTDIPGTFNAGATLGPVNETNMARIWNKHKQTNTPLKRKVFVAMSGGVDSSVAAALLKKQGFFVAGAYMKNFSGESWAGVVAAECPWRQDMADAQAVCEKLSIEFRSFNFEKEYADRVIEYFFAEYAAGRTPNPDIMCNREIKFGLFLQKALELGFDYIATGHYARINNVSLRAHAKQSQRDRHGLRPREDIQYDLLKGVDQKKDQSYFLCELNQEQLSKTLFPIGEYTKTQVRELARNFGLPNAEKKDSQGVCFIGHINLREFLKQRIPERAGEIVTTTGQVIGQHRGAAYYTIGQREGIGVGGGMPYYVVQKDVVKNRLVVSTKLARPPKLSGGRVEGPPGLYTKSVSVSDIHWIGEAPKLPLKCSAKIRYQQPDQECVVRLCEDSDVTSEDEAIPKSNGTASHKLAMTKERVLNVEFKEPQFASAPGQTMVFYDGNRVLGGGIIQQE